MKEELVYMGVDIAKSYLDGAIGNEKRRFANVAAPYFETPQSVPRICLNA